MTTQTLEQIAQPGVGVARAAMAFQGPDTTVTVAPTPARRIEFTGNPPPAKKDGVLLPPSLANRVIECGSSKTQEEFAEDYGLHWVRITKKHADGTPAGVIGVGGQYLNDGDEVQLPGNVAASLATDRSAVFIFSGADKAELDFMERARKMGYRVEAPRVKAEDRSEFQFLKKRRKPWMAGVLEPSSTP
jgi:hypothetical protein